MELPATQAMDDELPPTQQFVNDEEIDDSPVGTLIVGTTSYSILRGITSIGRHPHSKVHINDVSVSVHHATIEAENSNSAVFIKDVGSTNNTKINNTHLRPNSNYQIKDGDKIRFGSIDAKFKLFQTVDDSLISCTPQINRKVRPVIPGTPDSMNASSASEGDVSMIPGTQNDGICFRRPETSSKRSLNNDHTSPKVPAFSMDDFENSIYSAETQRSSENKSDDKDESIYEMETQRSSDMEKDRSSIEDLETQQCDPKILNSISNKSQDVSIYSAETQKQRPKDTNKDKNDIEDLETQRCDPKLLNNTTSNSYDASIYTAETQKQIHEGENNSIEDLETQRCDPKLLNITTSKSHDISIYSAETQKQINEGGEDKNSIEDLETQRCDPKLLNSTTSKSHDVSIYSAETQKQINQDGEDKNSIEDLETQRCDPKLLNNTNNKSHDVSIYSAETQKQITEEETNNSIRKSIDVSIYSAETQKLVSEDDALENLETQQFIIQKPDSSIRKSIDASIYYAETQKVTSDVNFDESIENMETQKIDTRKPHIFQTPNLPKIKSAVKPLSEMETQKYDPDASGGNDVPLEDAETERFNCEKSNLDKRKSERSTLKSESVTKNVHEAETQKYLLETGNKISNIDGSIDDLETQQFISNNPNIVINESTNDIESQKTTNPKLIEVIANQSNTSKCIEEANKKDIIDQPKTVHRENVESFSEDNSSINNVDISKNAEFDDVEDEMFSQNLIDDCPFEFHPDESLENGDQETSRSKNLKELEGNKSNIKGSISTAVDKSIKSNISIEKNPVLSADSDVETDEEGIFSNPTSTENSKKTNIEKSNSDSETDEEGVFLSHVSKESENSEISAKNKCSNTETDEGVFSNPSKSNEKLHNENNETDSETDEEGVFSNSLSKTNEIDKNEIKTTENNNRVGTTGNDITNIHGDDTLNNSLETDNKTKQNKSVSEPSKLSSLSFKRNSSIRHSPIPDSDDSLFDDIDDTDKNKNISGKSELKLDKSFHQFCTTTSKDNESTSNENDKKTNSVNISSNANESSNVKEQNSEVDHLAPTQILDTSKSIIDESDSEDECMAPTQVISPKKGPTTNKDQEDIFLEPTQVMTEKSPVLEETEKFEHLILSPTQKIETQDLTEPLSPTEKVNESPNENERCSSNENEKISSNKNEKSSPNDNEKNSSNVNENYKIDRNGSVEDLDYEMAPTQPIEEKITKDSMISPKRQFEELEITCNKKMKCDEVPPVNVVDNNIEKDLVQMFEGPAEENVLNQGPELLTQQLEDILQSSQIEEDPSENITMVPSPTISSNRKAGKAKNRRKAMQLKKGNTSSQEKKINIDLNDTIERKMNDMFNSSINDVESYEPDSMMTQQIANVLESQDHDDVTLEDTKTKVSPNLSARTSRSQLNASSSSKGRNKRNSKILLNSEASPVKEEPRSNKHKKSAEESQETEEYFVNLKSKKKRTSMIIDSQEEHTNENEKELVYKHGIVGFVDSIGAIRTSRRVPLYEPKSMPFTSDSQSEGEDQDSSQRQKRFNLSLSKNVDLNSSLSDYDLESTMTKTKTSAGKGARHKRVLAKGTRGFEHASGAPVECEELVSAPSTEGEEEIGSSQQKVGNLDSSLRLSLTEVSMNGARLSQSIDSDEEFLKSMPDVKVAGTVDCPPTSSQLAAPCDDNDDMISLASVVIPSKNQLYAQRRFDLIYKKPAVANANESSEDERGGDRSAAAVAPQLGSPLPDDAGPTAQDIEKFIAELGRKRRSDVTPQGTPANSSRGSRASKRRRGSASPLTPLGRSGTRSNSNLEPGTSLRRSLSKRSNNSLVPSSDSDSDLEPIICKYERSEEVKNFKLKIWNMTHPTRSAVDDEPDENDLEFARLREQMERQLARKKPSPRGARGGKKTCALTGRMLSGGRNTTTTTTSTTTSPTSTSTTTTRSRAKAGIADEDASVFQVSSAGGVERGSRRRAPLAITRSKRTAAEDSQNQPPKRAKTQNDHVRLQELSKVNDQNKKAEKSLIKFPKPSESYVVLQRTKTKADNVDTLLTSNEKKTQIKGKGEVKPTTRRNKAAANETTKAGTSIAKGLSSSKDSVVVEDSDAESSKQSSTRGTRSRRNNDSNSSARNNNSKDESSGNSSEEINKSTRSNRGKTVRQTQKKSAPIKNETIIPDSDQESDEPMSKSEEEKTVHRAADSEKVEEAKKSTSKSTRSRRVKDSDTEKLDVSEPTVNPAAKSRRNRKAPIKIVASQDSDSEFSEENKSISRKDIKSKKNVKNKASSQSDSERSTSSEKNSKLDIPAENKNTRSTRRAKAQNSSNSVFSESDNDQSKNSSVANESKISRSVRHTRKRGATDAISSESQEESEFAPSSTEKSTNASRTRTGRAAKKTTTSSSSSSSQTSKRDDSQSDNASDKSTDKAKHAKVIKSMKNPRSSQSPTPSQSLLSPTRSRRSSIASPLKGFKHKVLFTGDKSEAHKLIASKLGATVIDDPGKCTILVTDKVRRTCKFFCCVARGIPIVSFSWLDESLKAQHFLDWEDYLLEDPVSEAKFKFNLKESLEKARKKSFLEGYTVLCSQIPSTVLSTKELKDIVTSSGGKPLFRAPAKWPEKIVIVTIEDKLQNAKKLIAKAPKSVTIHSTEFLFTGILRQEVNFQDFQLSS